MPTDPSKQADQIASVAAEGSLLAHDAAEGDTTETFTRVHADALRESLARLEPKVQVDELRRLLRGTDAALAALADAPGNRARAARVERMLDRLGNAAEGHAA